MDKLRVLTYPSEILTRQAAAVENRDLKAMELPELVSQMFRTLEEDKGIGLAAPQVGISKRLIVIKVTNPLILLNPEVLTAEGFTIFPERCLSLPGIQVEVLRRQRISVRYRDLDWKERTTELEGLEAVCVQHEIDHLNGILLIHHGSLAEQIEAVKDK